MKDENNFTQKMYIRPKFICKKTAFVEFESCFGQKSTAEAKNLF